MSGGCSTRPLFLFSLRVKPPFDLYIDINFGHEVYHISLGSMYA